jgi:hypothetical protein
MTWPGFHSCVRSTALALLVAACASGVPPEPAAGTSDPDRPSSTVVAALPSASVETPSPSAPLASNGLASDGSVVTRVVIEALGIDLPIVPAPLAGDDYPYCNVAMYLPQFHQPGDAGATYVFAHARAGMFLPLLDQSRIDGGARLKGMHVEIYTSDDHLFVYAIADVRRHTLTLDDAIRERRASLYLQTSEGPHGTPQKLQVIALPVSERTAPDADAHPVPHPVVCG